MYALKNYAYDIHHMLYIYLTELERKTISPLKLGDFNIPQLMEYFNSSINKLNLVKYLAWYLTIREYMLFS